jgi:tetratricopeptide (TPR) repeat protein
MPSVRFIESIAANLAYWHSHGALNDPRDWSELDRERANLFLAVEYGLRQAETWPAAAGLAVECYRYVLERGYWSEWAQVLEQGLLACPDEVSILKGRLAHQLGDLNRKRRRLDEAHAAHRQAEVMGRALGDSVLVARAQLGQGEVHYRRREYEEAESYALLALDEFKRHDTLVVKLAQAHNLLGMTALGRGEFEESGRQFYMARDLFQQVEEPIEKGRTSVNLAQALGRLGRVDEALALAEEAGGIFDSYGLPIERSRLYVNLGFIHYSQGDLARARAAFRQAYTPAMRRAGPLDLRSLIEMNLGNVLLQQGELKESQTYFLSASAGFRLINNRTMLANSLDGLAEIALANGEINDAIASYEEALEIVISIPEDAFANRMEARFRELLKELSSSVGEES